MSETLSTTTSLNSSTSVSNSSSFFDDESFGRSAGGVMTANSSSVDSSTASANGSNRQEKAAAAEPTLKTIISNKQLSFNDLNNNSSSNTIKIDINGHAANGDENKLLPKPFFVKGAGGDYKLDHLRHINSFIKDELNQIRNAYSEEIEENSTYNPKDSRAEVSDVRSVVIERQGGLANRFVLLLLVLWYFFSALTLFTNKYIVSFRKADPTVIGTEQMLVTSICGFIQLKKTHWKRKDSSVLSNTSNSRNKYYRTAEFWRSVFVIAILRLFSIVMGLMALKQSAVSFVETVKSSSPIFTVFISKFLIGEVTGLWTKISLIPIMLGLALCSSFEINFSFFSFLAAICTNFTECLQNVFSKLLLCSDRYKFTPLEVQFFSSAASVIILVPICYFTAEDTAQNYQIFTLFMFVLNGICFHCQTLLAFTLMSYISPVTHSVCNTLKRAILIWVSVIIFQNQVGYMSAFGTFMVVFGVLLYNQSKNIDKRSKNATTHKM